MDVALRNHICTKLIKVMTSNPTEEEVHKFSPLFSAVHWNDEYHSLQVRLKDAHDTIRMKNEPVMREQTSFFMVIALLTMGVVISVIVLNFLKCYRI